MKCFVVYPDGALGYEDIPAPKCGDYDAVVKMEACGICKGTDSKIIHKTFKGVDDYPVILGHEGVGRVVEKGPKVTSYNIGDRVLLPFLGGDNVPRGLYSAWGAYAEYNTVTDAAALERDGRVPDEFMYAQQTAPIDMDPACATMLITFREVYSTMKIFGFRENCSLVVLGLGPVGLSFVRFAKLIGMRPIIALGRSDDKRGLAKKFGADYVFDSESADIEKEVAAACPGGADFALDAVGSNGFINMGLRMIKPFAKVCVYGISAQMDTQLDWGKTAYNWTLQFNQFPSKKLESEAHAQILNWVQLGLLDPSVFISHTFDFPELPEAFAMIERHEPMLKMAATFK